MQQVKDMGHKLWLYEHLNELNINTQEFMSGLLDGSLGIEDFPTFFLEYAEKSEDGGHESEVE